LLLILFFPEWRILPGHSEWEENGTSGMLASFTLRKAERLNVSHAHTTGQNEKSFMERHQFQPVSSAFPQVV
jgi:hypothetical protein